MMKVIVDEKTGGIIKSWCQNPEQGALDQAINLANLPFLAGPVALMPDTHQGYGMPIGGVIGTIGVVIPNAVGVDIGCGMHAVKTNLTEISTEEIKKIMSAIRETIPLGFNHRKDPLPIPDLPEKGDFRIILDEYESAKKQIGTLGGGNHFIEIQKGSDGFIWYMVHSGSRNLGKKVADHYNKVAKAINERWFSSVPLEWQLAFLPLDTQEGQNYLIEMQYCLDFALANRKTMSELIFQAFTNFKIEQEIDIHHNYARMEHHKNKNVMVHRKGATSARLDELGLIPGSQGTASYVVSGKGNLESYNSCSHGAGRKMGRKQACNTLSLEEEVDRLNKKGLIHAIRTKDDLEEAAGAYKDIDIVMEEQKDLVDIVVKLEPLAVIKG
jgi:tRNA-splicing ligase RtcB